MFRKIRIYVASVWVTYKTNNNQDIKNNRNSCEQLYTGNIPAASDITFTLPMNQECMTRCMTQMLDPIMKFKLKSLQVIMILTFMLLNNIHIHIVCTVFYNRILKLKGLNKKCKSIYTKRLY